MTPQVKTSLGRFSIVAVIVVILTAVLSGLTEWNKHHDLTLTAIAVITELVALLGSGAVIGQGDANRAAAVRQGDLKELKESDVGYHAAKRAMTTGA